MVKRNEKLLREAKELMAKLERIKKSSQRQQNDQIEHMLELLKESTEKLEKYYVGVNGSAKMATEGYKNQLKYEKNPQTRGVINREVKRLKPLTEKDYVPKALEEITKVQRETSDLPSDMQRKYVRKWLEEKRIASDDRNGSTLEEINQNNVNKYFDSKAFNEDSSIRHVRVVIKDVVNQELADYNIAESIKRNLKKNSGDLTTIAMAILGGATMHETIMYFNSGLIPSIDSVITTLAIYFASVFTIHGVIRGLQIIKREKNYEKNVEFLKENGLYDYVHKYVESIIERENIPVEPDKTFFFTKIPRS